MTSAPVVAILEPGYADYSRERELLATHKVEVVPIAADRDAVSALSEIDPVAVMVRERTISTGEMAACPNLRVIVRYGVGVDNIDLDAARARNIRVANVPDYGAEYEVSDHAVALYLAVTRRIISRDREVRAGAWGIGQAQLVPGRRNAVLGLIGYGRIARMTCHKFRALGFARILVFDPYVSDDVLRADGVEPMAIDDLVRIADVVSLHTPLTPSTHHIVDAARIALMKPSAVLLNVSRGGLIDEIALAEALQSGRLFGAGLDVFEHEPPGRDHPLMSTPNTILTDHTAWYSEESVSVLQEKASLEVRRVLDGEDPLHWVNRWQ